jgi:hypothetical protein
VKKIYISADQLLSDSYALAAQIFDSGFKPDLIVGVWRGGAPVAIAVQEYLDYLGVYSDHIAIRANSYKGVDDRKDRVQLDGMEYLFDRLGQSRQLLILDDVFDTGRSVEAITRQIIQKSDNAKTQTIKVACPWYKPSRNLTDLQPDFHIHETADWLVFPHELKGLTREELIEGKGDLVKSLLDRI